MKLLFKQRMFTLLDNYNIYDEKDRIVYAVEGQLAVGHCLKIYDQANRHIATLKQRLFTFLPKFDIYMGDSLVGSIHREFRLLKPKYYISPNGWSAEGDIFEWDYSIQNATGETIATVSKELLNWTDTYSINVKDPKDALFSLLLVLAVDVEKCSRK